jgi:hypothetical protein
MMSKTNHGGTEYFISKSNAQASEAALRRKRQINRRIAIVWRVSAM